MDFIKNFVYRDIQSIPPEELEEYNKALFIYETAMKILNAKLDVIKTEYDHEKVHSDIQSIKYRIKEVNSIQRKLDKNGLSFNVENINEHLNDVVGARIVCLTVDDVDRVIEMIKNIHSIKIVNEKDYIRNPKDSGYRSYHMIVQIPVPLGSGVTVPVNAEIQIRTVLMDAWSSLEHEIIYKNKDCTEQSREELHSFGRTLETAEFTMNLFRKNEIQRQQETPKCERRKINKSELRKFKDFLYVYEAAARILETYIDIVKSEYEKDGIYSDIQKIKSRIKSIDSIDKKLATQDKEFTMCNIQSSIKDVVAARIVCLDRDDVYRLVEIFKSYPGLNVISEKDYIKEPKESGYRAYHIIIEIPVELSSGTIPVRTEIQFRTVLMDAWSSLEHETIYKNPDCSEDSRRMLTNYSYLLNDMDMRMLDIKKTEMANIKSITDATIIETDEVEENKYKVPDDVKKRTLKKKSK